ncbi:hypothetical protein D5S18_00525 [Nocardia panacis]|uniref:Uncharacterized protein n=1 Tax=Nocardia panacis TaxID=2340916 RepID=A0A3A4L947_9NOCA|nr:hypothetical protein [Nocardia panacis]RJO79802.1 hypothetical protein D5S18_00525 [Nocardia panacis]
MSFQVGCRNAARSGAVARLRGATAGTTSGAISVAAHGWAAGGAAPSGTTLMLLVAGAAVIGALVAGALGETVIGLVTALAGGQVLGHITMGWSSGHMHHGDMQISPAMVGAHLVAAVIAAVLIRGAEGAYRFGCAVLSRVLPRKYCPPAIIGPATLRLAHRDRVILRLLAVNGLRSRGPPTRSISGLLAVG